MLRGHRTAVVDAHVLRARRAEPPRPTTAQLVLAPLCILAAGAAFVAEVIAGDNATTFGALSVVPVLAASLLRSRALTLMVAAFAMILQAWGVRAGVVSRDAAGMQISVYMLTLAVAALQQARSPLGALDAHRGGAEEQHLDVPVPVIRVTGVEHPPMPSRTPAPLPADVADALTRRERDVVQLAVQGLTAREIGSRLFIGDRTVETHLANAYGKLGVRSKVELARVVSVGAEDHTDLRTRTDSSRRASA